MHSNAANVSLSRLTSSADFLSRARNVLFDIRRRLLRLWEDVAGALVFRQLTDFDAIASDHSADDARGLRHRGGQPRWAHTPRGRNR